MATKWQLDGNAFTGNQLKQARWLFVQSAPPIAPKARISPIHSDRSDGSRLTRRLFGRIDVMGNTMSPKTQSTPYGRRSPKISHNGTPESMVFTNMPLRKINKINILHSTVQYINVNVKHHKTPGSSFNLFQRGLWSP
jgi:hypothetical protein